MKPYPQEPEDWKDGKQIIYRKFKFNGTPDIECLMRLVKDNIYDGGNSGYLRARLLGVLYSMYSDANRRFWKKHKYPKTWRIRLFFENVRRWYHRAFNTEHYRGQVMLYDMANEIIDNVEK